MNFCFLFLLIFIILKLIDLIIFKLLKDSKKKSSDKHVHFLPGVKKERKKIFKELINDINKIIKWCLNNNYPSKKQAQLLQYNWNKVLIHETNYTDHVAYVVDKNQKLYLCASTPHGSDENRNTMRYVVFHELAHMMSESYGHNDEFGQNFLAILRVGVNLGIYIPVNYTNNPVNYCGTKITNSLCDIHNCSVMK